MAQLNALMYLRSCLLLTPAWHANICEKGITSVPCCHSSSAAEAVISPDSSPGKYLLQSVDASHDASHLQEEGLLGLHACMCMCEDSKQRD